MCNQKENIFNQFVIQDLVDYHKEVKLLKEISANIPPKEAYHKAYQFIYPLIKDNEILCKKIGDGSIESINFAIALYEELNL